MIKLENVTKTYSPDVTALQNANFDIAKGEFVFLVGPSGSGKSTMLRLMNRQERPEKGAVWVAGRNINDMPDAKVPHLRRNIGNIFQDYSCWPTRPSSIRLKEYFSMRWPIGLLPLILAPHSSATSSSRSWSTTALTMPMRWASSAEYSSPRKKISRANFWPTWLAR